MKHPFFLALATTSTVAFLILLGCHPATVMDTDPYSDSDADSDSDPDGGQDTDTDTDTGTECDDLCLDDYGKEIPGCLHFCGGIGMVVCESADLECVYSPDIHPDQGGICIPWAKMDCYDDEDCGCMPPFETACYGAGAIWTCPTSQCVPECAE